MLPELNRRSPKAPATPSPKPRAFDFDGDERKPFISKKILGLLAGIFVLVVIAIFFPIGSSTTSELQNELNIPAQAKQNTAPAPDPRHVPPAPHSMHPHENTAADILTRLKNRLDTNKFSPADYRKMTQKVKEMYPDHHIPEDLIVNPAPDANHMQDELDLGHIQNRRGASLSRICKRNHRMHSVACYLCMFVLFVTVENTYRPAEKPCAQYVHLACTAI